MLKLVSDYSQSGFTLGDQYLPWLGVVEDDDGIRVLISTSLALPLPALTRAQAEGVAGVWTLSDPETWVFIPWDEVAASTSGSTKHLLYPRPHHHAALAPCPFRQVVIFEQTPRAHRDFVHLHAHSEYSSLDGLSFISEMVDAAVADNQPALALTDHGVCAGHPQLQELTAKAGIKPLFGIEAYLVDDRYKRPDPKPTLAELEELEKANKTLIELGLEAKTRDEVRAAQDALVEKWKTGAARVRDYYHLVLWAMTQEGLRNLWAISTKGWLEGFYSHPRVDWEILAAYSEGVMASTACLRGPVNHPLIKYGDAELGEFNLGRLLNIYGDNLVGELHTNQLDIQHQANAFTLDLAKRHGIPTIAVVDSHYPCADDLATHKVWLAAQTNSDLSEDGDLFGGDHEYHMMTEDEVRTNLAYLGDDIVTESITNTVMVADRCNVTLTQRYVTPTFSRSGGPAKDLDRLVEKALGNWDKVRGMTKPESVYAERFEREMSLLNASEFNGYFLMTEDQVNHAKRHGVLVGPGRGSGAGCLVAYLLGITGIDPVEHDLLFERFLTEGRKGLPDFDVDYPASKRDFMQRYVIERWGAEHVLRVGTQSRLGNKGVFQNLARIYKDQVDYNDFAAIAKIITEAESGEAGLGLSFEDLMVQCEDQLAGVKAKYPRIFELAERLSGRLKTYGRHAAGIVIAPDEDMTDNLPLRSAETSELPISQFDMEALEFLGYVKWDFLTLRTLDTLQECIDLVKARHGVTIDVDTWRAEYDDPAIWDEMCNGHTLGIFQAETAAMTKLIKEFQPRNLAEMADVITLVRPGPRRSGLTDAYLRRRAGREEVAFVDERLAEVLAPTQGTIIYQEQVMRACQLLGGYTLPEADAIRKILGKKQRDKVKAAGEEFIPRCVERGMTLDAASHLWSQLGEFALYSFNKSHALSYAVVAAWTAWFKVHYPAEFLAALLSTVDKDRVPEFVREARRMGFAVTHPDINASREGFTIQGNTIRYGFPAVKDVGPAAVTSVMVGQPYTDFDDFLARKGPHANTKVVRILARIGAFDSVFPNRRALVERLDYEVDAESARCVHVDASVVAAHGLACRFDWASEPVELTLKGKPKKAKPPPKRCTKACRHYTAPTAPAFAELEPYSPSEIRGIEIEYLGVELSSTPFDVIPADVRATLTTGDAVLNGPLGRYAIAATVSRVKAIKDSTGRKMGFLALFAQDAELDVVVFNSGWEPLHRDFIPGRLCFATVTKTDRGISLTEFVLV